MIVYNLNDNHKKKGFKIEFSRDGGMDMCDEWIASNSWSFVAWQDYRLYDGSIHKNSSKSYRIIIMCGYTGRELLTETWRSLKESKSRISEYIQLNYKMFGFHRLYSADNFEKHIFKIVDDKMTWVASSIKFKRGWQDPKVFGYGTFYYAWKYHWVKDRVDGLGFGKMEIWGCGRSESGFKDKDIELEITKALYLS